uniref:Uncharacterized protein n=1 Tax=Echinococcus granulosus TaxID=6210 RepID=U6JE10_ECHGR|nr:hypothetical protein EgrG_002027300 [Echinococcus granulosus]CDS22286.1 hypothetical protein EgrG_002027500 [Echinococcus granulosus]
MSQFGAINFPQFAQLVVAHIHPRQPNSNGHRGKKEEERDDGGSDATMNAHRSEKAAKLNGWCKFTPPVQLNGIPHVSRPLH